MNESVAIVFVVNAKGHTVSQILGVFVEEATANSVRNAYAELWVTVEVEAWVLDYSAAPDDIVEAVMGKKIKSQDEYEVGDMVAFREGNLKGYGEIIKVIPGLENIYCIEDCKDKEVWNMYHSEIIGAAK